MVLCKQTDYKSNREVFAKEYTILAQTEQNQPLCTYVYISLDMCKESLHFHSCGLRSLWQKGSPIHKTIEQSSSNGRSNLYQMWTGPLANSRWDLCGLSSFKDPQISHVCLFVLNMWVLFLNIVPASTCQSWKVRSWCEPDSQGQCVQSSSASCRLLLTAFVDQVLKTIQLLILQMGRQRHEEMEQHCQGHRVGW